MEAAMGHGITRRGAIVCTGLVGAIVANSAAFADEADGIGNALAIHQEENFDAPPERLFQALTDGAKFTAFSTLPATIDPTPGGSFSLFGGIIFGRNIEVKPNERLVQAWGDKNWPEGLFSVARFVLKPRGTGTLLIFDHTGFPNDIAEAKNLVRGWNEHYWDRLRKYLA
jgi:activator of HSP90 ATPase